jgi:uncharacterized protein YdhG (YjbR/CyaY superfamily)
MSGELEVTTFINQQPSDVKRALLTIRETVRAAVPLAEEVISYGIPTFKLNGKNMLHYGPGKHHIGVYATPDGHAEFEEELSKYKRGKGSVQFPIEEPMPLELVKRIALFRSEQLMKGEK